MKELIDSRKFVKAWMTCETVEDVAKKLDLRRQQVSSKAHQLRKQGVRLPKKLVGGNRNTLSVGELNEIIDGYNRHTMPHYTVPVREPLKAEKRKIFAGKH